VLTTLVTFVLFKWLGLSISHLLSFKGKVVLVVEVVPIEPKWREIQARGAIAGVTGASPGIIFVLSFSLSISLLLDWMRLKERECSNSV